MLQTYFYISGIIVICEFPLIYLASSQFLENVCIIYYNAPRVLTFPYVCEQIDGLTDRWWRFFFFIFIYKITGITRNETVNNLHIIKLRTTLFEILTEVDVEWKIILKAGFYFNGADGYLSCNIIKCVYFFRRFYQCHFFYALMESVRGTVSEQSLTFWQILYHSVSRTFWECFFFLWLCIWL